MKKYILILLLGFVGLYFTACSVHQKIYRNNYSSDTGLCNLKLPNNSNEWFTHNDKSRCAVQKISLPNSSVNKLSNSYKLTFLEFDENKNDLLDIKQLNNIKNLLSSNKPKFLIVFVHGWRHDANYDNRDIKRFKLLLAYSRKFMNQREEYKNFDLVGLYAAWRGKSVKEPNNEFLGTITALPTFWKRKQVSDQLGKVLIENLRSIEDSLGKNSQSNKMLIVGHSMGGNMLMVGLKNQAIERIKQYPIATKQQFEPLLGDLVVLINPASEASNWIDIQKQMRMHNNKLIKQDNPVGVIDFHKYFPITQKPVLVSLTAACNWGRNETNSIDTRNIFGKKKVRCDHPTNEIFSIANILRSEPSNKIAIGHFHPQTFNYFSFSKLPYFGTTHELVLNGGANVPTQLQNLNSNKLTQCKEIPGALTSIRQRAVEHGDGWAQWDSGSKDGKLKDKSTALTPYSNTDRTRNYQIRRGLYLSEEKSSHNSKIIPANAPFWNMRVLNGIEDHGGYVNYPTWCFINQFVLDDITAEKNTIN